MNVRHFAALNSNIELRDMRYAADTASCWIYDNLDHSTLTHLQPQSAKLYLPRKLKEDQLKIKIIFKFLLYKKNTEKKY